MFTQEELDRMRSKVRCPSCGGLGYHCRIFYEITNETPTYTCDACVGSGMVMRFQADRIKALELDL